MRQSQRCIRCFGIVLALTCGLQATAAQRALAEKQDPDSGVSLRSGEDGTAFESLTIEGEDRIRIEFERPLLTLELDPLSIGGLDGDGTELLLARSEPDFIAPFLAESAGRRSRFLARPWFAELAQGNLATFRPELEGVHHWNLLIADSRGDTMVVFAGDKRLPDEIAWDGRTRTGQAALPGLTYSYVLTAWDKAGNKRNFVGEGFELPAYRLKTEDGRMMLFAGRDLAPAAGSAQPRGVDPPLLYEVASLINEDPSLEGMIRLTVKARSYDQAAQLGQRIATSLYELVLGDPARIQMLTEVESHAPEDGVVIITAGGI